MVGDLLSRTLLSACSGTRGGGVVDEDGGRPGALLGLRQAVLVDRDVGAGVYLDAAPFVVAIAVERINAHGLACRLDGPHVVDRVAPACRELVVGEQDLTARGVGLARVDPPRVLDGRSDLPAAE